MPGGGPPLHVDMLACFWSEEQLQAFLDGLAHVAIRTPGILTLAVITEDPPNDRYLECAVEGEAAYIVSGDQLLLRLGAYQGILILTPRAFLEVLQRQTSREQIKA